MMSFRLIGGVLLSLLLTSCAARYQAVTGPEGLFLLDAHTGRVWIAQYVVKAKMDQNGMRTFEEGFPKLKWVPLSESMKE